MAVPQNEAYHCEVIDPLHQDLGVEDLLRVMVAKQDCLEKRLEILQASILEHLKSLRPSYVIDSFPSLKSGETAKINEKRSTGSSDCLSSLPASYGVVKWKDKSETENKQVKFPSDPSSATHFAKSDYQKSRSLSAACVKLLHTYDSSFSTVDTSSTRPKSWRALSYSEAMLIKEAEEKSLLERPSTLGLLSISFQAGTGYFRRRMFGSIKQNQSCLANLVHHPLFQGVCGSLVLMSCILVGITIEADAGAYDGNVDVAEMLSRFCTTFFVLELLLRVLAFGVKDFYIESEDRLMNIFDTLIVGFSVGDIVLSMGNKDQIIIGYMKRVKVFRIFRIFRFVRELSFMALMICECLTSLFWAIVLLMLMMYVFAAIFTQGAIEYKELNPTSDSGKVDEYFGTMTRTFYYLFQSMLGGVSWGVVSDTLMKVGPWTTTLFFFYIAFTMLCVLNVITGIFVDNALETSRMQREYIVSRQEKAKARSIKQLVGIFDEMDEDGSGMISWEEMETALESDAVAKYFSALGLHYSEARKLFDMIDEDNSGQIDLQEFLDGCTRYTGDAKSIDIHAILHVVKRLQDSLIAEDARQSRLSLSIDKSSNQLTEEFKSLMRTYDAQLKQMKDMNRRIVHRVEQDASNVNDETCSPRIVLPASLPLPLPTPAEEASLSSLQIDDAVAG